MNAVWYLKSYGPITKVGIDLDQSISFRALTSWNRVAPNLYEGRYTPDHFSPLDTRISRPEAVS
jgi:hypothetical protein